MRAFRCALVLVPFCVAALGAPNISPDASYKSGELATDDAASAKKQASAEVTMTSDEVIDQKMAEVMGLATEFKKAPVVKKMARFLLDFGGSNDVNTGYTTSDGTANLFNLDIDSAAVMEVI